MKSLSIPPGKINLRTQFFKAKRLAMALAVTGGLFLAAAAQAQVLTDLGSNSVTGYNLPATVLPRTFPNLFRTIGSQLEAV